MDDGTIGRLFDELREIRRDGQKTYEEVTKVRVKVASLPCDLHSQRLDNLNFAIETHEKKKPGIWQFRLIWGVLGLFFTALISFALKLSK